MQIKICPRTYTFINVELTSVSQAQRVENQNKHLQSDDTLDKNSQQPAPVSSQINRPRVIHKSTRTKTTITIQTERVFFVHLILNLLVDGLLVVVQQLDLVVDGLAELLGGRQRDRLADGQRLALGRLVASHQVTGHHADVVLG